MDSSLDATFWASRAALHWQVSCVWSDYWVSRHCCPWDSTLADPCRARRCSSWSCCLGRSWQVLFRLIPWCTCRCRQENLSLLAWKCASHRRLGRWLGKLPCWYSTFLLWRLAGFAWWCSSRKESLRRKALVGDFLGCQLLDQAQSTWYCKERSYAGHPWSDSSRDSWANLRSKVLRAPKSSRNLRHGTLLHHLRVY